MKKIWGIIFRSLFLFLNLLTVGWLFLCKWVSLRDPMGMPSLWGLLSFTTIFAVFFNVLFIFYWLLTKKKWRSLISLISLVLLWNFIAPVFGTHLFGSNDLSADNGDLKVMTWNVHLFDLGAWTNNEDSKNKIIDIIKQENPDVLCLEEFYRDSKDPGLPYTDILRDLGYPYIAFYRADNLYKRMMTIHSGKKDIIEIGNIIFSKFPISNVQEYDVGWPYSKMLSADVQVDSVHKINVNVVHLTSIGFGAADKDYISEVKETGFEGQDKSRSKKLASKLTHALARHAILAKGIDSVKRFIDNPIIICGDFNEVPTSFVYEKAKGDLSDAFVAKGFGLGRTYREIAPTLRIDYIFYDGSALKVIGYGRRLEPFSDHYPVIANFKFRKD